MTKTTMRTIAPPTTLFLLLLFLCSRPQQEANGGNTGTNSFSGIPDTLRELQQDENVYYVEEDCFCSRRVLVLDKTKKAINVYSWCVFQKSPGEAPDMGAFLFKKYLDGRFIFEKTPKLPNDPGSCIVLMPVKADTMVVFETCDKTDKHTFIWIGLSGTFSKRVPDCSDVEG